MKDFAKIDTSEPTEESRLFDAACFIGFVVMLVVFCYVAWVYSQPEQYI